MNIKKVIFLYTFILGKMHKFSFDNLGIDFVIISLNVIIDFHSTNGSEKVLDIISQKYLIYKIK